MTAQKLVEHFFRHEYGRLVSTLSCRVGFASADDVEDAVQSALMSALECWTVDGLPDDPSAWLFRVANNNLLGELRTESRRKRILEQNATEVAVIEESANDFHSGEAEEDLLRMLFICCDEAIPVPSQIVFALKTLCGFDIREISVRLFTTEANVYKRLSRARMHLRITRPDDTNLKREQISGRLSAVRHVLYLLFTEGFLSSDPQLPLRRELCEEAIRLARLLSSHPVGKSAETSALLALMYFHMARMNGRQDKSGALLLLEEQDRSLWDACEIQNGFYWLGESSSGEKFSRYHAEAGIAAEHCLASSFQATRWERIAKCYAMLEQFSESPIHKLNRAVAVAEWKGPVDGLAILEDFEPPTWLCGSYLWATVMADLNHRAGNLQRAQRLRDVALETAPSEKVKELILRRMRNSSTR